MKNYMLIMMLSDNDDDIMNKGMFLVKMIEKIVKIVFVEKYYK